VPLARRVALAYGVVSLPSSSRLHTYPVPCLGGVAIGLTALGGSTFLPEWSVQAAVIILGAALVGVVGLIDDVRTLQPRPRLIAESIAALVAVSAGARLQLFGGPLDWLLSIVWLVGVTNSFNLLDNMDGAAGTIATTTSLVLMVVAHAGGQRLVAGMAALVLGSSLGFLVFNWHPARIFMGDAGSLFLGFLIAATALKIEFTAGGLPRTLALLFLMGPAALDTTLVVVSRLRSRRPIHAAATDHMSHRLLRLGLSARAVALILAVTSVASAVLGVGLGRGVVEPEVGIVVGLVVGLPALGWLLMLPDSAHPGRIASE
jgi:UDP-GlcNAc:undecaprenyl-phosphate GlcNAc-1-phosphate transferase